MGRPLTETRVWIADYIDSCCRAAWGAKWYDAVTRFWEEHGKDEVGRIAILHRDSVMADPSPPNETWSRVIVRETALHIYGLAQLEHGYSYLGVVFDANTPAPYLETENGPDPISIDEKTLDHIERECSLRDPSKGRNILIDDLRYGRATPQDAEAEAKRRGWPPLANEPDAKLFDPLSEPYWTLAMTVAWITWRNTDAVRENWNAFREHRSSFRFEKWHVGLDGEMYEGWLLEHERPATLAKLQTREALQDQAVPSPPLMSIKSAHKLLWKALQEGSIRASGIPDMAEGLRVEIPRMAWQDLECYEDNGKDVVRPDPEISRGGYTTVTIANVDAREMWPEPDQLNLAKSPGHLKLQTPLSRRGPKPKVNSMAFETEVHRYLEEEGAPDPTADPNFRQSDVERHMMMWHQDGLGETRNRKLTSEAIASFRRNRRGQ